MDLARESQRLRLDLLAVQVSRQLDAAGVPHALLKGPSTAMWLYRPPRLYNDVDVLVPLSRFSAVINALREIDIVLEVEDFGPPKSHSVLMHSSAGFEVDVHVTLPTLTPDGDRSWDRLSPHVVPLDLGVGVVPALDEPARCVVVALHALNSGLSVPQVLEDLRRARQVVAADVWSHAEALAGELGASDLFRAGVARVDPAAGRGPVSLRAYLRTTESPALAIAGGVERLGAARARELPGRIWGELFPPAAFVRRADERVGAQRFGLARAHLRRWRRLARQIPSALQAWRAARSGRVD